MERRSRLRTRRTGTVRLHRPRRQLLVLAVLWWSVALGGLVHAMCGLWTDHYDPWVRSRGAGAAIPYALACRSGVPAFTYLVLLVVTRRVPRPLLPWRLGRFLRWCYDAGLLRVSGATYQFRHKELQDHLAAHPVGYLIRAF